MPHREPERRGSNRSTAVIVGIACVAIVAVGGWLFLGGPPRSAAVSTPSAAVSAGSISTATPAAATASSAAASDVSTPVAPAAASEGPTTIGSSVDGVAIDAYRFGSGPKRYLILGGIHGNEYGGPVAEALVKKLSADPTLVPAGTEIDVIPMLNPDGHADDTRANAHGVDLNRNFPSKNWVSKLPSGDTSAQQGLNGGTSPASEPEIKALVAYLKNGYAGTVTLHSKGGIVDYDGPGGLPIARRVSSLIGLPISHLAYQPYVRGSMGIYVPEKYHIPVITLELTSRKLDTAVLQGILAIAQP